jgi:uncharacterized protein
MPNRLAAESSPYLLQHAHNPVDWYPWGEDALRRAREENRPIFLSIGYAACHWCHVMERESFEDEATAAIMNEHYVCIKVDREERPDLDAVYMQAVTAMTGRGGWPMSVWLTPEGVPFYGGTYFPDVARFGMPSFQDILLQLARSWETEQDGVRRTTNQLQAVLERAGLAPAGAGGPLDPDLAAEAVRRLEDEYDWDHGGWSGAPKFPQPMLLEFLLAQQVRTGSDTAGRMVEEALSAMAEGGIYDHLGGGFHRYSTDELWLVPHFEKMLYDNSQLARVYVHAWQVLGIPAFRRAAEETLDYVAREMTHPAGGFYSTQDADSDEVEGKFFVWSRAEAQAVLGDGTETALFLQAYGLDGPADFEGRHILHVVRRPAELAAERRLDPAAVEAALAKGRRRLFVAREARVKPSRDDKVLTGWNGLMLAAFAEAASAFERPDYLAVAEANAAFLLGSLRTSDGRLLRTWKDGQAKLRGYLEDYACLAEGLLALYQATFDPRWFEAARELADACLRHFSAPEGGFFDTADDHEQLIVRPRALQDNAVPSGGAMTVTVLLRLHALTGVGRYAEEAERALASVQGLLRGYPAAFGQWLCAHAAALVPGPEIAVVGPRTDPATRELLAVASEGFLPGRVVAWREPREASPVPLLAEREPVGDAPTAWVCRRSACLAPVTSAAALRKALAP